MSDGQGVEAPSAQAGAVDLGDYCRRVEEHLARANDGHLIRIVGPGFELVRGWALDGIPLSIVCHGISLKAERHREGRSKRPLRLEFCDVDVRVVFDDWRRAIGLGGTTATVDASVENTPQEERRRPSLTRHLDRVIERLGHVTGKLDRSDAFRDDVSRVLDELGSLRDRAKSARGPGKDAVTERLPALDEVLLTAARREAGADGIDRLRRIATDELAPYRTRLSHETWSRSLDLSVDRLLCEEFGLPTVSVAP